MKKKSNLFKLFLIIGIFFTVNTYAQNKKINQELNFTIKFLVSNDTVKANKEYSLIINGPFPKDNSGHQGGRKQNMLKTDKNGQFKLYILNPGEYEFIVLGKGNAAKKIEKIKDYEILIPVDKASE
tara:strand:- start:1444 stop:1821 length:378 start_codon:yes stop_codon:yes gene_type:complete